MLLTGLTLLVVEDDRDHLDMLSLCLASEGATVVAADSIESALVRTAAARVDLLLCNLLLADGDGCVLLGRLRERAGPRYVPAISMVVHADRAYRKRGELCGFDGYVVKPVSLDDLVGSIVRLAKAR